MIKVTQEEIEAIKERRKEEREGEEKGGRREGKKEGRKTACFKKNRVLLDSNNLLCYMDILSSQSSPSWYMKG
jgi:hypothetical protein